MKLLKKSVRKTYDKENMRPVIRASICTGEQVAGFKDIQTGKIEEVVLIKCPQDLEYFKSIYGITGVYFIFTEALEENGILTQK